MVTSPLTSLSTHTTDPAAILALQKQRLLYLFNFIVDFIQLAHRINVHSSYERKGYANYSEVIKIRGTILHLKKATINAAVGVQIQMSSDTFSVFRFASNQTSRR